MMLWSMEASAFPLQRVTHGLCISGRGAEARRDLHPASGGTRGPLTPKPIIRPEVRV
jgi:hypothetical protein